ncbi:hypothetical protein [Treponema sp. SP13]|uniref:hypothetical protein n=1 Tax=Treponema sp. SP13 TaxID=2789742 RepID=UPI003D8CF403
MTAERRLSLSFSAVQVKGLDAGDIDFAPASGKRIFARRLTYKKTAPKPELFPNLKTVNSIFNG